MLALGSHNLWYGNLIALFVSSFCAFNFNAWMERVWADKKFCLWVT